MADVPAVVIVGESLSSRGSRPFEAGPSRARLEQIFCSNSFDESSLEERFQLVNLCGRRWRWHEAVDSVKVLMDFARLGTVFVLCGRKVQQVFGYAALRNCDNTRLDKMPYFTSYTEPQQAYTYVIIPHPSGLTRVWNDPEKVRQAQQFLRRWR